MRGDIADLRLRHPDLADKFVLLRDELDWPAHSTVSLTHADKVSSWELQIRQLRGADGELNRAIQKIRAQPGFSNFFQPLTTEKLRNAANQGPIIVNIGSFRCDAFIVQRGSICAIELPDLTQEVVVKQAIHLQARSDLSSSLE